MRYSGLRSGISGIKIFQDYAIIYLECSYQYQESIVFFNSSDSAHPFLSDILRLYHRNYKDYSSKNTFQNKLSKKVKLFYL